jgi:cytochrome bd ubiquinol oxidase subunit II
MDTTHYQVAWFGLLLLFLVAYSVLDGFDLGVGILIFFTKSDKKRNLLFSALAPIWDGNELWLVIAGASLFAVFPQAYATTLSGFYLPIFFIATGLMLRAAAFECRHLCRRAATRRAWERVFAIASFSIPFLLAVALGNIIAGIPLTGSHEYGGSILFLFRLYPCALAATGIAIIILQGSLFAACKLPTPFSEELRTTASRWWHHAAVAFVLLAISMLFQAPQARSRPVFWVSATVAALALVATMILMRPGKERLSFLASSIAIVSIWFMQATALFPDLIRNSADSSRSITIFNGSAEIGTLRVLAGIAVPATILYLALNWYLYTTFKGKLSPGADLYGGDGKE